MKKEGCFNLGFVSKTQGIKGGLIVYLDVDDPTYYKGLESVFVEINHTLVPFFIAEFQLKHKGFAYVKFEDVDGLEESERLVKKQLYLPETQLPKLSGKQFYFHEIIGFAVHDIDHGPLGTVEKVFDYPGNPLLQVVHEGKEVLVPIHDPVIRKVDRANNTLEVAMPEGLIDLYLNT